MNQVQPDQVTYTTLPDFLGSAMRNRDISLALLLLVVTQTRTAWRDRCSRVFEGRRGITPCSKLVADCIQIGKEKAATLNSGKRLEQVEASLTYLQLMLNSLASELRVRAIDSSRRGNRGKRKFTQIHKLYAKLGRRPSAAWLH
ncbi:hypothetical protein R1sor_009341 [Riccia sorocarpa]|uniref:Uncharacterized protein n=1 Tax=Riccia sorocarpa TaxID=122646 RepID=A0ABD3HUT4_9MARC